MQRVPIRSERIRRTPTRSATVARTLSLAVALFTSACGARRPAPAGAPFVHAAGARCEVQHELTGAGDTIEARIEQIPGSEWIVSLRMNVRLDPNGAPVPLRGLGRIVRRENRLRCVIVESDGAPGTPRFDEPVCLDEVDSLRESLAGALGRVNTNESIELEVATHGPTTGGGAGAPARTRRRRLLIVQSSAHRAELSRDARGRVTRVQEEGAGRRELVTVQYFGGDSLANCLPEP